MDIWPRQGVGQVHLCSFSLNSKLLLQRLWHLGWWWARQPEVNLHGVVDKPLQGGQCTDHDDTGNQSLPHSCKTKHSVTTLNREIGITSRRQHGGAVIELRPYRDPGSIMTILSIRSLHSKHIQVCELIGLV